MQCGMLILEAREGGANMVMSDMRYMWSEIDSPLGELAGVHRSTGEGNILVDTKSAPSFTLGGLETLENVEEWNWRA